MNTIIPTAEQVAAFKAGWEAADKAGLTGARTILGLTAALNVQPPTADFDPTPARATRRIIDQDGDIWIPAGHNSSTGEMLWRCPSEHYMAHRTRNQIASNFGIHKEEFE